jgi:hypothetical protein
MDHYAKLKDWPKIQTIRSTKAKLIDGLPGSTRTLRHTLATPQASISMRFASSCLHRPECSKRDRLRQFNITIAGIATNGAPTTIGLALTCTSGHETAPARRRTGAFALGVLVLAGGGKPAPPPKRTNPRLVPGPSIDLGMTRADRLLPGDCTVRFSAAPPSIIRLGGAVCLVVAYFASASGQRNGPSSGENWALVLSSSSPVLANGVLACFIPYWPN